MPAEDLQASSRWIMRALEWDDPRARYPNIWVDGMPRHILANERVVSRLRLGDLVAVFYPASTRHADRAERFVGMARVTGLRGTDVPDRAWVDLRTAHRFRKPLELGEGPRRVFLCCDPGWPDGDVGLFRRVFEAAVAEGWEPSPNEQWPSRDPGAPGPVGIQRNPAARPTPAARPGPPPVAAPSTDVRWFAGAGYSGDMRDPRDGTWLAVAGLGAEGVLTVRRLEATGRTGLQRLLRDPDRSLMEAEAIGLDFPFALPAPFAAALLGEADEGDGWWALARRLTRLSRPEYLVALQDFREAHGEIQRLTDEHAGTLSPLHRVEPDLGSRTFHGIRMLAEDRSRYAVRPFENAEGKSLFEVSSSTLLKRLAPAGVGTQNDRRALLDRLAGLEHWPLRVAGAFRNDCMRSSDALDAVLAARATAVAVLGGEADRRPEELAPGNDTRVRREGWIYGLGEQL